MFVISILKSDEESATQIKSNCSTVLKINCRLTKLTDTPLCCFKSLINTTKFCYRTLEVIRVLICTKDMQLETKYTVTDYFVKLCFKSVETELCYDSRSYQYSHIQKCNQKICNKRFYYGPLNAST